MKNRPQIEKIADLGMVLPLLKQCGLPTADIADGPSQEFFGCCARDGLKGLVGLERHGSAALLRSLAVSPGLRGRGLGRRLVAHAEQYAASQGVISLFLLTTTAADFFAELGYAATSRDEAPSAIQASAQFSGLCPASSTFMSKHLSAHP